MSINRRRFINSVLATASASPLLHYAHAGSETSNIYKHGVASGDPLADGIILWTRISQRNVPVTVRWQVSESKSFETLQTQGSTNTDAKLDYTVKVDVRGLNAGQHYFYRFIVDNKTSPIGRCKTLPTNAVDKIKLGITSCSNYSFGHFNVYRHLAEQRDLDALIHLGDYIYEYERGGYDSPDAEAMHRSAYPKHEITTLADYRLRHAQYKTDPDLQRAHATHSFICSWDDHETANDSWSNGAENHSNNEGDWQKRKAAALQAYYEWMPSREPSGNNTSYFRSFQFGQLATLAMIETRLSGRDKQLDYSHDLPYKRWPFDFSNSKKPKALAMQDAEESSTVKYITVPYDITKKPAIPVLDYQKIKALDPKALPAHLAWLPDTQRFESEVRGNPTRKMIDAQQQQWLQDTLSESKALNTPWQLIGNQTIMAEILAPNFYKHYDAAALKSLNRQAKQFADFSQLGLPYNLDSWDGYPKNRQQLLDIFASSCNNTVVLTGDTHNAWANNIHNPKSQQNAAVEVAVTSITSPGAGEYLKLNGDKLAFMMQEKNPAIAYTDTQNRGYCVLSLTAENMSVDYFSIDTIKSSNSKQRLEKRLSVVASKEPGTKPFT